MFFFEPVIQKITFPLSSSSLQKHKISYRKATLENSILLPAPLLSTEHRGGRGTCIESNSPRGPLPNMQPENDIIWLLCYDSILVLVCSLPQKFGRRKKRVIGCLLIGITRSYALTVCSASMRLSVGPCVLNSWKSLSVPPPALFAQSAIRTSSLSRSM